MWDSSSVYIKITFDLILLKLIWRTFFLGTKNSLQKTSWKKVFKFLMCFQLLWNTFKYSIMLKKPETRIRRTSAHFCSVYFIDLDTCLGLSIFVLKDSNYTHKDEKWRIRNAQQIFSDHNTVPFFLLLLLLVKLL